ncbi:type IV secretion protein Rhs, partial [Candidatus Poribacteria bacterium]
MLLILSTFLYVFDTPAENEPYTLWGLPDGAKARLGKGRITDITCSPDGALLAVASQIGIWIYDVQTSEALALFTGHTGAVDRISFSPDGRVLASGGQDNTVRLWDVETQTEIGTLDGHTGGPNSLWFSPDGRTLASRDDDQTLRLWDVETQTQIHTLEGHTGTVESVSFSPDGQTIASGGQDNSVRLWDVSKRTEIGKLEGHTGYVSSVSFSPDGKTLVSGSHDGTVRLWDVTTRTEIGLLEGHIWPVSSVSFSPDGKTIASGSHNNINNNVRTIYNDWGYDSLVRLWDVDTQAEIGVLEGSSTSFSRVSFSPDGQTIAQMYTWAGYNVRFWDVETQTRINLNSSRNRKYSFFAYSVFDHTMWDVLWVVAAQAENIHTILNGHTYDPVFSVAFSPDGKTIAASDGPYDPLYSRYIRMWDAATLTEIDTFNRWSDGRSTGVRSFGNENVSFSPDGKTILSRCEQGVICLRDAATYTEIRRLEIPGHWA